MANRDRKDPRVQERPLLVPLIVAVVVAAMVGSLAGWFYFDLARISPCDGGLAPGGPSCTLPAFQIEALGHTGFVNGSYVGSFLISPNPTAGLHSSDLSVSVWNDSGTRVVLRSVVLYTSLDAVVANFSLSGANWTTGQSVDILNPDVLTVTSVTNLQGQYITVDDTVPGGGGGSSPFG
jgi:hypothetical protein